MKPRGRTCRRPVSSLRTCSAVPMTRVLGAAVSTTATLLLAGCASATSAMQAPTTSATSTSSSPASAWNPSPPVTQLVACPAGALKIGRGPQLSPATGEHGIILSVTSVAPPCTVTGYPTITMQDTTGSPIHFTYVLGHGQYVTLRPPRPVTVGAGKMAYFLIAKYRCDTGSTASAVGMTLVLPGQGTMTSVPTAWIRNDLLSFDFCSGGRERDPGNTVEVSPFESATNLVGQ